MPIGPGTRLGPYEVAALIGEGGMGKVWRAQHTALKRDDALKVLPDEFAQDPDRLARFRREAQVLASLNHPNIAHVHGLEQSDGVQALVMELVEGPTLADRIAQGPMPVDEALPIAKQIAEALEAAHERGIIHRDLKPANVKLRPDGVVKVLDFGLAKALEPASGRHIDATASPTITSPAMMTGVGMLLGTAAYMSPEQARGKAVDKRSDIWAFGCVLYEMLTGKRAFDDPNVNDTLASVLKSEPDWNALSLDTPLRIRTMVTRCLEKDPRTRIAHMSTVLFVLDEIDARGATGQVPSDRRVRPDAAYIRSNRRRMSIAVAAALVLGAVIAGGTVWLVSRPDTPRVARFGISPTGTAAITAITLDRELAITPDGTHIVYVGNSATQLFVRALDQLDPSALTGVGQPRGPFVSPDGQWIGFFDIGDGDVTLKDPERQPGRPAVTRHDTI